MSHDADPRPRETGRIIGRYALYDKIASGGMASVHFARLVGPLGFTRVVAVKRLHPQFAKDPEFVTMLLDEARLAARVRHPNVVPTIDVVATDGELFLVMEYVQGESLGKLIIAASEREEAIPPKIAITILIQALWGLHAAHEAKTPRGASLGVIHRDVSPQNILVGDDGVVRIVDFGVAKAAWRAQSTREGQLKGKIAYMPPEQLRSEPNQDRRVDVYAASVCLWEALTNRRYVDNDVPTVLIKKLLAHVPEPPSKYARGLPRAIDAIVLRGLAGDPANRFATAYDMATELERAAVMASAREVGDWVRRFAGEVLDRRAKVLFDVEGASRVTDVTELGGLGGRGAAKLAPATAGPDASTTDATPLVTDNARTTPGERETPARTEAFFEAPSYPYPDTDTTEPHRPGELLAAAPRPQTPAVASPEPEVPAPPRRLPTLWSVGGAFALAALGVLLVSWAVASHGAPRERAVPPAPAPVRIAPAATPAPIPIPVPPPEPAPIELVPSAPAQPPRPAADPAASASVAVEAATATPQAPASAVDRRDTELTAASPPAAAHGQKPNCHPPYTLDSEGVRIPKRECLHP